MSMTYETRAAWQNRIQSENLEHDVASDKPVELPERVEVSTGE